MSDRDARLRAKILAPCPVTAHDVRHLRPCAFCPDLGDKRRMVRATAKEYAHGKCLIAAGGLQRLLDLPQPERDKLTLEDIGVDAMRAILAKRHKCAKCNAPISGWPQWETCRNVEACNRRYAKNAQKVP